LCIFRGVCVCHDWNSFFLPLRCDCRDCASSFHGFLGYERWGWLSFVARVFLGLFLFFCGRQNHVTIDDNRRTCSCMIPIVGRHPNVKGEAQTPTYTASSGNMTRTSATTTASATVAVTTSGRALCFMKSRLWTSTPFCFRIPV